MQTSTLVRPRTRLSVRLRRVALGLVASAVVGLAVAALAAAASPPAAAQPTATAQPSAATPSTTPVPAPEEAAAKANDEVVPAAPDASEHEWLTDTEGRRYYLSPYPKSYRHQSLGGNKVRTAWGIDIEVDREDDKNLYYRTYETNPAAVGPSLRLAPPSEEVKASYELDIAHTDRLTFSPFDDGLPRAGQWRNGLAIADMDGDGHLDIVHGPARKSPAGPIIFLGDGKGQWHRWNATFPSFPYDYGAAAVADLDHDGRMDIVLGVHLHGLVALVQKKRGQFELWNRGLPYRMSSSEPLGFSSRAIALLDWNKDGRPDIAALSEGPQLLVDRSAPQKTAQAALGLIVFLNGGDGSWAENPVGENGAKGLFGDHLVQSDLDGDGRPDLIASSNVQSRRDLIFLAGKGPRGRQGEISTLRPAYTRSVAAGNFSGDKNPEVAASFLSIELQTGWRTGIDVFQRGSGDRWQRRLAWVEEGKEGVWSMASGDVDGDHHADLVAITGDGRVIVLLGDGKGGFVEQDTAIGDQAEGCHGYSVVLADLDHDHRDEIIASFAGEPAGIPGLLSEPGCPAGGSLHVWKPAPKSGG